MVMSGEEPKKELGKKEHKAELRKKYHLAQTEKEVRAVDEYVRMQ